MTQTLKQDLKMKKSAPTWIKDAKQRGQAIIKESQRRKAAARGAAKTVTSGKRLTSSPVYGRSSQ